MNRNRNSAGFLLLLATLGFAMPRMTAAVEGKVDFNRDIRPILSDKCFACHGPDDKQRKARLRFDRRDDAFLPAKSGARAIVPGRPEESEMVTRITTSDADDLMPPAEFGKPLKPSEIEVLQRWIAEGAKFRDHWSFIPPERPPVPQPKRSDADIHNPIDAFIEARLEQDNLTPQPEADRATLIRRATLGLTGLPPTPDEIDAFLADPSQTAYESMIDRLLESPRYGERMAVEWLDAARFADTHGYHLDSGRDMTAWRDWVIQAYNDNLPFDQFTVDQLAGDLLPEPTTAQRIATGFNRNHMINYEGGAIAEEYHYAYLVDRVNTTGAVWLGLSMSCAQCHDHKYDPLSMREFYQFLAFFNGIPERGLDGNQGNASPTLRLATPDQERELARLGQAIDQAENALNAALPEVDEAQESWARALGETPPVSWTVLAKPEIRAASGAEFRALPDQSFLATGAHADRESYSLTFTHPLTSLSALRLEVLPDESLGRKGPGRADNGNFVLTEARLTVDGQVVAWRDVSADFSQESYPISASIDGQPTTGWAVDGGIGKPHAAIFRVASAAPVGVTTLTLDFHSSFSRHAIGRFRLSVTDAAEPHETTPVPEDIRAIASLHPAARTPEDAGKLRDFYRTQVSTDFKRLKNAVAELRKERSAYEAAIRTTMVMTEMERPRETHMHLRGQYDQLGDKVTAGVPSALTPLPAGAPPNRLGLALWLTSTNHPLTARVAVNRYWQLHFGHGIVKTAEDFGSQGEWPSHPELLDWLARDFMENGWDVKRLQRLMLTSAAYRRSSRVTPDLHGRDPENRLLARGPRFRLEAEFIRDQALAISGLLEGSIGGASVSPYQPLGLWSELSMREDSAKFSAQTFVQSRGSDLYRRSMYTFWKRSSPPPQLTTFDAPNRETCTLRRPRTNTPLQALILLNDPTYVEASRKLAERILARATSDADRVAWAFRLATARFPNAREHTVLLRVLNQQRAHYHQRRDAAEQLLSNGEAPRDLTLDPAELAAWTVLSSTILNLNETVTKG